MPVGIVLNDFYDCKYYFIIFLTVSLIRSGSQRHSLCLDIGLFRGQKSDFKCYSGHKCYSEVVRVVHTGLRNRVIAC